MTFRFSLYSPLGYVDSTVWESPLPRDLTAAVGPGWLTEVFQIPALRQTGLGNSIYRVPAENKSSAKDRN
jgi:hypothetical protein